MGDVPGDPVERPPPNEKSGCLGLKTESREKHLRSEEKETQSPLQGEVPTPKRATGINGAKEEE